MRTADHLPPFITAQGGADVLMIIMAVFLVVVVFGVGLLFFRLHHLPEHIAKKSQKVQYQLVAILGLLAMFTHVNAFWIAALLLAVVDIPDFGGPLGRMARALEKMAGARQAESTTTPPHEKLVTEETIDPQLLVDDVRVTDETVVPATQDHDAGITKLRTRTDA